LSRHKNLTNSSIVNKTVVMSTHFKSLKTTTPSYLLGGIYLDTAAGTPSLLNAHEFGTFTGAVTVAGQITAASAAGTFRYERVGIK
jgi:hypothetical protein